MDNNTGIQDLLPLVLPSPQPITAVSRKGSILESFNRFHEANPQVYTALAQTAVHAAKRGRKMGIGAIYERVRWEYSVETPGEPYRLNNNFRSHYARLIMKSVPELAGYFETRKLRTK